MRFCILLLSVLEIEKVLSKKDCRSIVDLMTVEKSTCRFDFKWSSTDMVITNLRLLEIGALVMVASPDYEKVSCTMQGNECIKKVKVFEAPTAIHRGDEKAARLDIARDIKNELKSRSKKKVTLRIGCTVVGVHPGRKVRCLVDWPFTSKKEKEKEKSSSKNKSPPALPAEARSQEGHAERTNLESSALGARSEEDQAEGRNLETAPGKEPNEETLSSVKSPPPSGLAETQGDSLADK